MLLLLLLLLLWLLVLLSIVVVAVFGSQDNVYYITCSSPTFLWLYTACLSVLSLFVVVVSNAHHCHHCYFHQCVFVIIVFIGCRDCHHCYCHRCWSSVFAGLRHCGNPCALPYQFSQLVSSMFNNLLLIIQGQEVTVESNTEQQTTATETTTPNNPVW